MTQGIGVCVLPYFLAHPAGLNLIANALTDGSKMRRDIYIVVHADLAASRRVRRVADCLADALMARRTEPVEP